jgi:hypothetical protein
MRLRLLFLFAVAWFGWACYRLSGTVLLAGPILGVWLEDKTLRATVTLHHNSAYTAVGFYAGQDVLERGYYFAFLHDGAVVFQHPTGKKGSGCVKQHVLAKLR